MTATGPAAATRPIILVGVGRCGSTLVHRLLAYHPQVAWISGLANKWPGQPWINGAFMRAIDLPGLGPLLTRAITPSEHYHFWERHCPGFPTPFRDLVADDLTVKTAARLRRAFAPALTPRRDRLLLKITGWPRIGLLHQVFPEARFVHVVRDGRAVASSLLDVDFWWGWRGPESWQFGPLSEAQDALWARHGRSFAGLAALNWQIVMAAVETARQSLPADRLLQIRYEEVCADPVAEITRVAEFAGLQRSATFRARLAGHPIRDRNDQWRRDLTAKQQAIIIDILGADLHRLGYR